MEKLGCGSARLTFGSLSATAPPSASFRKRISFLSDLGLTRRPPGGRVAVGVGLPVLTAGAAIGTPLAPTTMPARSRIPRSCSTPGRPRERLFEVDDLPEYEIGERLLHRLHPARRARLHHGVELLDLRLADEVPNARRPAGGSRAPRPGRSRRAVGSSVCVTTACSEFAIMMRTCCCCAGGKTSMTRSIVEDAVCVWRVPKTRWPVSAAVSAVEIVSRSRISPTRMTSGSWRSAARRPSANDRASVPISRWLTMHC